MKENDNQKQIKEVSMTEIEELEKAVEEKHKQELSIFEQKQEIAVSQVVEKDENKQPANVAVTTVINITSPPLETADKIIPIHDPKTTTWLVLRQYSDNNIKNIPKTPNTIKKDKNIIPET